MISPGQMIMTGVSGTVLTDEEREFLENEDIGGVILFAHNFETPAQLAELINSIQTCRREYPLFISVDHEGGRVIRFKKYFTQMPSAQVIAGLESPKTCFALHKIMAEELNAVGINVNFAPVCDVFTNPKNKVIGDRAFGTTAEEVSKFVSAAIRGLQTNKVLACGKHFPGHGDTLKDSHFDLPVVEKSIEELEALEIIPFRKAVTSRLEFMMMSHIVVKAFDENLPCTLAPKAHEYLRTALKYKKIIISDDMEMKAIVDNYSIEKSAVMAINAGCDMLIYRSMEGAKKALDAIKQAMKVKEILNDDVSQKVKRIMDCKKEYFKEFNPVYIPSIANKLNTRRTQILLEDLLG